MSNTKRAMKGDIVRYVGKEVGGLTVGRLYQITADGYSEWMSSHYAELVDDKGAARAFWNPSKYEVIGKVEPVKPVIDIQGNPVSVGCTIAYAYGTGTLTQFEVQEVNVATATVLARAVKAGTVTTLGVLNERAVIIK